MSSTTGKSLTFDGLVRKAEMVADVSRNNILYHLVSSLGYDNGDPLEWKVPDGTSDTEVNPLNLTTATGLIIRVNRKPAETDKQIKVRIEDIAAPLIPVGGLLVLFPTSITRVYVSNDSGNSVDSIIHFFG